MICRSFGSVLGEGASAENRQAKPDRYGGVGEAGRAVKRGSGFTKKTASRIDVRQTCHFFPPSISDGSVAMLGPREAGRQSETTRTKKEKIRVVIFGERKAAHSRCTAIW